MALRIPWDKYESALLLDMYFKVASGEIKRQQAVVKLSADLRNLAINRGIVIDDIFRNTNGISLKMCEMQYIVTDGKSGLKKSNPVKIFKNIVDTYNNNREEYNKILEEAREMINSDSTFKNNYFTWLSQKVSRKRLSEIYIEYEYIEGLLLKRRLITDKLFSTRNPDIIYSAIKVLENDTNLKRYYKFNDYFKDLSYYYDYLISGEYNSNPTPVCSNSYKASAEKKETVQVEKTQENNTAENNSRLQLSRGQHFLDWLLFKKSYNTEKALDIVGFMISAEDFANNNNLPYQDILDVQAFEAEQTIGILSKNKEFRSLFKQSKRMTNFTIFSQYLNYVRINNITIPTSQHLNSIKNNDVKSRQTSAKRPFYNFKEIENADFNRGHGKYSNYFALWLVKNYSASDKQANQCTDLLAKASIYAISKKYTAIRMLDCNNYNEVQETFDCLFKDNNFVAYNKAKSNIFGKIFKKYLDFLKELNRNGNDIKALNLEREVESAPAPMPKTGEEATSKTVPETILELTPEVTGETMPEIVEILKPVNVSVNISEPKKTAVFGVTVCKKIISDKFRKGFRIESNLDLKKFRSYLSSEIGKDNLPNDNYIKQTIRDICKIFYGGKLYCAEFMLSSEKKNKLQTYIDDKFDSGKTALYYKALFEKFQVDFAGECIYSDDMLKSYLQEILRDKYYFYNDFISNQQGYANDVDEEIREIFINRGEPISLMEICEKLPHISEDKIEKTVKLNRKYIPNGKKKYFYVDVVDLNSSDISKIESIIEKHISQRDYILNSELFSNIEKLYPEILEKMSFISDLGRFSVVKYEFEKKYAFNGKIISRKGNEISYAVVYRDFAKDTPLFSMDDLKALKSELDDTPIKFDEIYSSSVRVSDTAFVSKSYANFDIKSTDCAISRYCTGDYIPLGSIMQFGSFPYCGFTEYTWNSYMLESYVFTYSKDYMLLHSAFNEGSCVGAIVKRDSEIVDYYDVLVREISDSGINLNKNEALELLQKRGFIVRKSLKEIESILHDAKVLRAKKGD